MTLDQLIHGERVTAIVGWGLLGVMALAAVGSFLAGAVLWGLFSSVFVVVAALPAVTNREWTAMVPWVLLLIATAAVVSRAVELYSEAAGYVAIVALAVVIAIEFEAFTSVAFGRGFALSFAVMTALALHSLWIIAQFYSDTWLGTTFLSTQTELQEDIVLVTVVAFAVCGPLYWYFTRFEPAGARSRSSGHGGTP
jgi:hypothetical protein